MNVEAGQLYTKNGTDFRVHRIEQGYIYGVIYRSEHRGNLDPDCPYTFRKITPEEFAKIEGVELVKE